MMILIAALAFGAIVLLILAWNMGMTFSEFLRRLRVEKAQEMYAAGECPKQEVPYAVGFSDAKYFAQVFKSVTGESPAEYLKSRNLK